jgi:hypothetical protein
MPADDPGRNRQFAFEATTAGKGLFEPGAPDPLWATGKPFLVNLVLSFDVALDRIVTVLCYHIPHRLPPPV